MADLHMEVEAVAGAQKGMIQACEDLSAVLDKMNTALSELQNGRWMGNSAKQFYDLYEDWRKNMTTQIEDLSTMATQLQNEIEDWENAASRLGG